MNFKKHVCPYCGVVLGLSSYGNLCWLKCDNEDCLVIVIQKAEFNTYEMSIESFPDIIAKQQRKVVQIVVTQGNENYYPGIFALCDDGTIFSTVDVKSAEWEELPPIPQPGEENEN